MAGDCGSLVKLFVKDANQSCVFLVDNGADISIFKEEKLSDSQKLKFNSKIKIRGIADGEIITYGETKLNLKFETDDTVEHTFHIVHRDVPIDCDGIIGRDFLIKYKCTIDYDTFLITCKFGNSFLEIPMIDSMHIIPPRSEIICRIHTEIEQESVVCAEEITNGVFIANAIVGKIPYVRFINTTLQKSVIKNFKPKFEPLENYHIVTNSSVTKPYEKSNRMNRLKNELKLENLTPEMKTKIEEICLDFEDIFYLKGDNLTTNNFYKQSINVVDNTPVFVKNYRLPHSHKEEIGKY